MKNDTLLQSFHNAINGIKKSFKSERNLKIHYFVVILVFVAIIYFKVYGVELLSLVLVSALVITAEMINSAIEKCVDLIQPEYHILAGYVKDVAAGAVLVSAIAAIIIGLIVFGPKLINIIKIH